MKSDRVANLEKVLHQEEAALRKRLIELLPSTAASGVDLFTNAEFNPLGLRSVHMLPTSAELLERAQQCISSRTAIGLPVEGSVGQLFISACRERAGLHPHSRGPRGLAKRLLQELQNGT